MVSGIGPFIATETKIALLERLVEAGLRRIEIGSFVSPKALPQMRDTGEILAACKRWPQLKAQVLVPNEKLGSRSGCGRRKAARVRALRAGIAQSQ
jgi:hydroxymethylglutaryl-CoA lyase